MSLKSNRENSYYLFWIYPLIFLGLAVFGASRDRHHREHRKQREVVMNKADSLKTSQDIDSILVFYTSVK